MTPDRAPHRFTYAHALTEARAAVPLDAETHWLVDENDAHAWPSFGAPLPPDVEPIDPVVRPAFPWAAIALIPLIIAACLLSAWLGTTWVK